MPDLQEHERHEEQQELDDHEDEDGDDLCDSRRLAGVQAVECVEISSAGQADEDPDYDCEPEAGSPSVRWAQLSPCFFSFLGFPLASLSRCGPLRWPVVRATPTAMSTTPRAMSTAAVADF
jgi:hypothetical protein